MTATIRATAATTPHAATRGLDGQRFVDHRRVVAPGLVHARIVRVDGPDAFAVAQTSISGTPASLGAATGRFRLGCLEFPVIRIAFRAPRSYTGNDLVEIQAPGSPLLLARMVEALHARGAALDLDVRPAGPGEFTARAFLNGRLSLTQAEGVAATIAARSDAQLRAATHLRDGGLARVTRRVAETVAGALALVEAGIDFTDQEDVVPISPGALADRIGEASRELAALLDRAVGMERLEAIPTVVLTGAANAGKSTLFNALLRRDRAVVSAVAGTTRDLLVEPLHLATPRGDSEVLLVDMAGLEAGDGDLDRRMQAVASEAIERADLRVLCVCDDDVRPAASRGVLTVRTKCDLRPEPARPVQGVIDVCAVRRTGLDELRGAIADRLADRAVSLSADSVALGARHDAALRAAAGHLAAAARLVEPERSARVIASPELVAASLRSALDDLADLAGRMTPDDVLGRIFASFCVGK